MKRMIAATVIFILVITVSITGNVVIHKYGGEVREKIEAVITSNEDNQLASADEFLKYWEGIREKLSIFVNHEDVNEIGRVAAGLRSAAKANDREALISLADEILFMINRIEEDESLSLFIFL